MITPLPLLPDEPLYVRLKVSLRNLIRTELGPGDQLPSESELCTQYQVSRITVRQALGALENEGAIERRQGIGTFVALPKRAEPITYFGSVIEELAGQGGSASFRLVSLEVIEPDLRVATQLRLTPQTKVVKIRRVWNADRKPMCYQVTYIPHSILRPTRAELRRDSLYSRLEEALGEPLHEAEESIEAMLADPYRAELLQIKQGAPLLMLERVALSRSGRAVEYSRFFYNSQLVKLTLRARRATEFAANGRLAFRVNTKKVAVE
jgi:GntR family transcriptional regulator